MVGVQQGAAGDLSLEHCLKGKPEGLILLGRSLFGAFGPSAGGAECPGLMALEQKSIDIVLGVFPTVLMQYPGFPGQAHGGKAVVLGDDDIPGGCPVHKGKIGAVGTFVNDKGGGSLPLHAVGSVADQKTLCACASAQGNRNVCYWAGISINENFQGKHLLQLSL